MSMVPQDQPEKRDQPESASAESEPPKDDIGPPKRSHSLTPCEDAEWEGRMDELEVQRDEVYKNEVAQHSMIDTYELASIVKRLEALRDKSTALGQEHTRIIAHLEAALMHLNQAASELAEERGT